MGNTASVTPATVLAVVRGLLARDVDGQPVGVTGEDLRVLHEIRNLVDADFVRCVGVFDARGGAGVELHLSTKSWLRVNCRMSATSAHGRVAIARRLRASLPLPGEPEPLGGNLALAGDETGVAGGDGADVGAGGTTLSDAMFAGGLSYEHAVAITRAVDALPAGARGAAEQVLVGHAPTMDPGTLRRFGEGIRETLAPELLLADAEAARDRRFLNVSPTFDGMVAIDGML
ncbi:MAG: hypothetical protein JWM93_2300, partial [Frankiales bacterium]|nr:hypothetical protein [Frankiales bacterium]